jgi:hypothetical protein
MLAQIIKLVRSFFSKPVPHNSFPTDNQGVLEGVSPTDFVAGAIPFEERNPSADWRPYLPDGELQRSANADGMHCVSSSNTNSSEIQIKQMSNQVWNFSERFLAKMSNTTRQGNWLNVVAETVRKNGLVSEASWPTPKDFTWESFYTEIPDEVKARAKAEFPFSIAYEWVPSDKASLLYHLQHAPLQITIPGQNPVHAVVLVAIVGDLYYYYDSYAPFLKSMSTPPASAMKIVPVRQSNYHAEDCLE